MVLADMASRGVKLLKHMQPTEVEKVENNRLRVTYRSVDGKSVGSEIFDTVIWAVGNTYSVDNAVS